MEIRSCRSCKRLFNYLGGQPICPECKEAIEKKFYQVKEYIRDNPQAGMQTVADDMEVDVKQLRQWVKEERLQFSADSDVAMQCEKCGKKIYTGRYCDACKSNMANSLSDAFKADEPEQKPKKENHGNAMRFIKR